MIKKQTKTNLLTGAVLALGLILGILTVVLSASSVSAQETGCSLDTSVIDVDCDTTSDDPVERSAIWALLKMAINILTAGVGILAVAGVVWASVLYASAGGSPEQLKKAIKIYSNIAIGIIAYGLMYAFLNFITPGGLFG